MKTRSKIWLLLAASLLGVPPATAATPLPEELEAKHHHDLRGVITKVEAEKDRFEIKTDAGRVVVCVIDQKSTLKRDSQKVTLKEVRPGERARCHCAALRDGRHYSRSLLLETGKEK